MPSENPSQSAPVAIFEQHQHPSHLGEELRALGLSGRQVQALFVGEALVLGLAGAVLGLWTASAALYGRVKRWFRTHREKPGNW